MYEKCVHCGDPQHTNGACRRIEAIEYHPDGVTIKRVEYYRIRHETNIHHAAPVPFNDGRMTKKEWEREMSRPRG
jgi:hypothetical protein